MFARLFLGISMLLCATLWSGNCVATIGDCDDPSDDCCECEVVDSGSGDPFPYWCQGPTGVCKWIGTPFYWEYECEACPTAELECEPVPYVTGYVLLFLTNECGDPPFNPPNISDMEQCEYGGEITNP